MPVFDMKCRRCGAVYRDKYFKTMKEKARFFCQRTECLGYTEVMVPDKMMIGLDSTYEYYDTVFEQQMHGKQHRKEVMKKHGVEERGQQPKRTDKGKWI
jgi:hypothetical protein